MLTLLALLALTQAPPPPPPPAALVRVIARDGGEVIPVSATFSGTATVSGLIYVQDAGVLNVNFPATQAVSAASLPLPTGAATEATLATHAVAQASTTSGQSGPLVQGAVTTAAPTYVTGKTDPLSLTTAGALRVDGSGVTQPISGSITTTPSGTQDVNVTKVAGTAVTANNGTAGAGTQRVVIASDQTAYSVNVANTPTVTANAGTNLNTSALALDANQTNGTAKAIARGGAKGATTAADVTSTANGADHQGLDVQVQGTVTVSGTVTTTPPANASTNIAQVNGVTVNVGTGTASTGTQRVAVASDSSITANAGTNLNTSALALDATQTNRTQKTQVTDGTRDGTVKAASTAAGAADTSLVVALSPNSPTPTGSNVIGHVIADTGSTTAVTGNVTVVQPTGTNLHAVLDTTSTTAVTQATGTNLHAVLDTTSTTAVTQATAANLNAQAQGAGASGAAKAGNPVQVGHVFNTTQPTVTNGQGVEAQATARGALIIASGVDAVAVTANAGTNLNTSALALSAPQTDRTQKSQVTDGTRDGTVKAASTAAGATDTALVVALSPNSPLPTGSNVIGHTINDTGSTTAVTGNVTVVQPTGTNLHAVLDTTSTTAVTQATAANLNATVVGTKTNNNAAPGATNVGALGAIANAAAPSWTEGNQVLASVDLSGRQRSDVSTWLGSTAPSVGSKTSANSVPVVIASDQAAVAVSGTVTTTPPANASTNVTQFGGTNVSTGTGASGAGIPRVTMANDSSLAANQSVNVNQWGGAGTTLGQKAMASSVPVALASDQSALPVTIASMPSTPVTGAFFQTTQPVSGIDGGAIATDVQAALIATELVNGTAQMKVTNMPPIPLRNPLSGAAFVDGSKSVQPVSASTLPLPSNAAQEGGGNLAALLAIITARSTQQGAEFVVVTQAPPPLNPFMLRCNPVRRTNCQP